LLYHPSIISILAVIPHARAWKMRIIREKPDAASSCSRAKHSISLDLDFQNRERTVRMLRRFFSLDSEIGCMRLVKKIFGLAHQISRENAGKIAQRIESISAPHAHLRASFAYSLLVTYMRTKSAECTIRAADFSLSRQRTLPHESVLAAHLLSRIAERADYGSPRDSADAIDSAISICRKCELPLLILQRVSRIAGSLCTSDDSHPGTKVNGNSPFLIFLNAIGIIAEVEPNSMNSFLGPISHAAQCHCAHLTHMVDDASYCIVMAHGLEGGGARFYLPQIASALDGWDYREIKRIKAELNYLHNNSP
jgi:hypothetical protein